jgi:hypothetical protein
MDPSALSSIHLTSEGASDLLLGDSQDYRKSVDRYKRSEQQHANLLRQAEHYEKGSQDMEESLNLPKSEFVQRFGCTKKIEEKMDSACIWSLFAFTASSFFGSFAVIASCLPSFALMGRPPSPGEAMFFCMGGAACMSAPVTIALGKLTDWFCKDVLGSRLSYKDNKESLKQEKEIADKRASFLRSKAKRVEKRKNAQIALIKKQCADKKEHGSHIKQPDAGKVAIDHDHEEISIGGVRLKVNQ